MCVVICGGARSSDGHPPESQLFFCFWWWLSLILRVKSLPNRSQEKLSLSQGTFSLSRKSWCLSEVTSCTGSVTDGGLYRCSFRNCWASQRESRTKSVRRSNIPNFQFKIAFSCFTVKLLSTDDNLVGAKSGYTPSLPRRVLIKLSKLSHMGNVERIRKFLAEEDGLLITVLYLFHDCINPM